VRQGKQKHNMPEALPSICRELYAVPKDLLQSANTIFLDIKAMEYYNNGIVYEQRNHLVFGDM
jgi:hypothetical protein